MAIGLGSMDVPLPATIGLLGMNWKFAMPVRPGDTIHCVWRLVRKRPVANPRWGVAVWLVEVLDQQGGIAAEGELTRLVACREVPVEAVPRRRRRGRRSGAAPPAAEAPIEGVPDAPPLLAEVLAATPSGPARRRRRRSGGEPQAALTVPAAPISPIDNLPLPSPEVAGDHPAAPRRRRRRRSGSSGAGPSDNGVGGGAAPEHPAAPVALTPSQPPPDQPTISPLSRVLKRLRRP